MLAPGELVCLAESLRVLYYKEEVAKKAIAELVARKEVQGLYTLGKHTISLTNAGPVG